MSTPQAVWHDLPLGLQQRILLLTGNPCARRASKAWRDVFDAANDTLCFSRFPDSDQSLKASATAAAARMIQRSAYLTDITMVDRRRRASPPLTLLDLLAAGEAAGLATRLCKLTGIEVKAACAVQQLHALRQCTRLTHLDIDGSDLRGYLTQHGQLAAMELTAALQDLRSLTHVHVGGCQTRGDDVVVPLASAMQPLTQLQHLHLAMNDMRVPALAALVPVLSAMPVLQTLVIDGNFSAQEERADWAEALCALLSVVPGLTHLSAGNSGLQEEGVALLAPVLRGMTCLQYLNRSYNDVCSGGMAALAPALAALPNLHTLNLSACRLQEGLMSLLQPLLTKAGSPLRKLALCETLFMLDDARALAAGLSTAPQLEELHMQYFNLRPWDQGWMALAPGLSRLGPSLQFLGLGSYGICSFSDAVSADLASALQYLTGLTRLQAMGLFSSAAMVTISPALMGMRQLHVLNLHGNCLSAEGTAAFATVLPALSGSLTHLTLASCSMDAEAAASALAPALAQLVELQLDFNSFGPRGGQWLPPVLTTLRHLRRVNLCSCGLDAEGCMAIVGALKDRDGMLVQLRGNGVTARGAKGNSLCDTPGISVLL